MSQGTESSLATWSVPECLFTIDYVPRVLDEIRLSVVDAFFSLPRGGAEIGGLLLGQFASGRLSISGYRAVECEHAFGPSYTLSDRDRARLEQALAEYRKPGDPQPVGWYHSHTRSEIFLSDADREIHDRYFPKPWQVALVLRPHTFQPTRAGFFFREAGGRIHAENSYQEFEITPMGPVEIAAPPATVAADPPPKSARLPAPAPPPPEPPPLPRGSAFLDAIAETPLEIAPPPPPQPRRALFVDAGSETPVETLPPPPIEARRPTAFVNLVEDAPALEPPLPAQVEEEPPAAPVAVAVASPPAAEEEAPPPPLEDVLPRFLAAEMPAPKSRRRWLTILVVVAVLAGCGYLTRGFWWTMAASALQSVLPAPKPPAFSLRVLDANGQLQIQWDPNSPVLHSVKTARLIINDGGKARSVNLDPPRLSSGAFTYARETARVEVALSVSPALGEPVREQTTFLGRMPPAGSDSNATRQFDDLRKENLQLKSDLEKERQHSRRLEHEAQYLRDQRDRDLRQKRQEKQQTDK